MKISKEYEEFVDEFKHRKYSLYEKLCNIAEGLPIPPIESLIKKYEDPIEFCHLDVTPKGVFALAILVGVVVPVLLFGASYYFGLLTSTVAILIAIFAVTIFIYLFNYPFTLATAFRIRASTEMVLAIVYMTIAMKVIPNIEHAVKFAAKNLSGPLSRDLKKLIWDVYTGKHNTVMEALDPFIDKWKIESDEFVKSIYLIKTSFFESGEKRERMLNEAVTVILEGTRERMRRYSRDLKSPMTVLNALGILLPIVGLVFFPIMGLFMPEVIRPGFLIIGYNVILPITVYWMMKTYLEKRPATFHQPDLSAHPLFAHDPIPKTVLALSVLIPPVIIAYFYHLITLVPTQQFDFNSLLYSLTITWSISLGIIAYCISSTFYKLKVRDDIIKIESELGEVLFQFGSQLTRGMPIESALKDTLPKIRDLKISLMFEKILYNMQSFGMTFAAAVFDKHGGAINYYPSKLTAAVMRAVTEISKSGTHVLSDAMLAISKYLRDMNRVEEDLEETMSEVTSTMQMQSLLLAPLSAGIVVAMTAMIVQIMYSLKGAVESLYDKLGNFGALGSTGMGFFDSILRVNEIMPIYEFQLIVGFYMIEIVTMIAIFLGILKFGDDKLIRNYNLGKMLLLGTVIYTVVFLLIYSVFTTIMPMSMIVTT